MVGVRPCKYLFYLAASIHYSCPYYLIICRFYYLLESLIVMEDTNEMSTDTINKLKKVAVLPLEDGTMSSTSAKSIFFPLDETSGESLCNCVVCIRSILCCHSKTSYISM